MTTLHPILPRYFYDSNGNVKAVYIKIRPDRAVRGVMPNKDCLVTFHLGADHHPVGIMMHEPISGIAISRVVTELIADQNDQPIGVDERADHHFIPLPMNVPDQLALLEGLTRIAQQMVAQSSPQAPSEALCGV